MLMEGMMDKNNILFKLIILPIIIK